MYVVPIVIGEIVSEVVLAPAPAEGSPPAAAAGSDRSDAFVEQVVRRATERVLDHLRQEWER